MQISYRLLISVVAAVLCAVVPASITTRAQSAPHWQVGDVFVGVGSDMTPNGKYVVYDHNGNYKETLSDTTGRLSITTGCAIAPPIDGTGATLGESLYGTNFFGAAWSDPFVYPEPGSFGPTVTRITPTHPHTASIAVTVTHPSVMASESIVFDQAGNYFVGGIVGPFDGTEYAVAYIFKYSPANQLLATYQVPNGNKGADWIDLDSDGTLYYTSEDNYIYSFKPALPTGNSPGDQFGVIPITNAGGLPNGNTAYAMRVLPRLNNGQPSGFLVAMNDSVKRLDATGMIVQVYSTPVSTQGGSFFALNVSPDGKSFWTATEQPDLETATGTNGKDLVDPVTGFPVPVAPPRPWVYKFHIGTGELLLGPLKTETIVTNAFSVKGLCLKREYTAAFNKCAVTDEFGNALLDDAGNPRYETCQAREICSPHQPGDDDRDGLWDKDDPDCSAPGTPVFTVTIPDTENHVGDVVNAYPTDVADELAASPLGLDLTYTALGLPDGLAINANTGVMSGQITQAALQFDPTTVTVIASDGTRSVSTTFRWKIREALTNQLPTLSAPMATSSTHPQTPFTVSARRSQTIRLPASDPEGATLWVISSYSSDGGASFTPGLPSGYQFTNVFPDTLENRSPWIEEPADSAVAGLKPSWAGPITIQGTLPVEGVYIIRVAVTEDFEKIGCAPAPSCNPRPVRSWTDAFQVFTITVVNRLPEFSVVDQKGIVGKPVAPYQILATDQDGHTLTYSFAGLPPGLTASGNTISGVPTAEADYEVTVTVTDETGAAVSKRFIWRVRVNTPPSCGTARPTQVIWPPNHKFVQVGITGVTDEDEGDTITITVTNVYQDEPVQTVGSGATNNFDATLDGSTAWVRAERTGYRGQLGDPRVYGDGRVYKILFEATDGKESCTGVVTVGVPHDQGQGKMPIENGTWWNSITRMPVIYP